MTTSTTKKAEGLEALKYAITLIRDKIKEFDGEFKVIMAPKLVTAIDEADLARRLERAEAENAEVGGDDDEEEGDQEGMQFDPDKVFNIKDIHISNNHNDDDDDEDGDDDNDEE